nr:DNA repair endonuclease XPF isoform X1 [Onthophagus taurus]
MLEFEKEIFSNIIEKDGLVITAKGLTMDNILVNLIKVYSDPGNLVLVLNSSEFEEKYLMEKMKDNANIHRIQCTMSIVERKDTYLSGGVQFVTTRMLVVDMLKNQIPIDKITGFIVLRAHSVLESCQEAFVLRLFRQNNKIGFIKAFSNSPQSFTVGFNQVERIMRSLFVKELYLWPRFHNSVIKTLKQCEPQVIELHIPISDTMSKIQTCILDLMNLTVQEIKRINKTLEMQEITVENCLTKNFHKILQSQLDCIWHQLSRKSKQLVADLSTLRHLITTMLYADPVTFYKYLLDYRSIEYAQTANWVLLEPAEILFKTAESLVFNRNKELNPELCPKWKPLLEVLKVEIPNHAFKTTSNDNKVLILCQDVKTCHQLNQFLTIGSHKYLFLTTLKHHINFKTVSKTFSSCEALKEKYSQNGNCTKETKQKTNLTKNKKSYPISKKLKPNSESDQQEKETDLLEDEDFRNSYLLTMSQTVCDVTKDDLNASTVGEYVFEPCEEMDNLDLTRLCMDKPTIVIQTFKSDNCLSLQKTLEELQPNYIIMYHSNMTAIRQIEMYEARRDRTKSLIIYFLIHTGTVEEQSYLTTLRREKEAFEFLIETKSTMVVPEDQDGKTDICLALQRETKEEIINTRKGGGQIVADEKQFVIVDIREFRSELPPLIHKRGIEITPVQITVGDYILTPEICVERKSISDLIGSLNSGRLYQQCIQMSRYYTKPMLLIEFDQNKPFLFQNTYFLSSDSNSFDIQQKLLLLTLHFPKLKIIWSPSPYASAQLFEELKQGKEQPNIEYASKIGGEADVGTIESKYNSTIYDFVQKLPGITSKNIDGFLRNVGNMSNATKKTEDELKDILGNANDAKAFYSILHEEHAPKENVDERKGKKHVTNKFKFTKSKKTEKKTC